MQRSPEMKVMLTGGGTGGHINPGLAVISGFGVVSLVGSSSGSVPRIGWRRGWFLRPDSHRVHPSLLKGRGLLGKFRALARIPLSVLAEPPSSSSPPPQRGYRCWRFRLRAGHATGRHQTDSHGDSR